MFFVKDKTLRCVCVQLLRFSLWQDMPCILKVSAVAKTFEILVYDILVNTTKVTPKC